MPTTSLIAYARRGYSSDRYGVVHQTTFISADRADEIPMGRQHGWFEDGHAWEGCRLVHVSEPSWRCRAPVMVAQAVAA